MSEDFPKKESIIKWVIRSVAFGIFLFLNFKMPYITDDWHFKFVWTDFSPLDAPNPMKNLKDVIESCQNYYQLSGGRVVCHFFAFVFCLMPKAVLNIVNSFVFIIHCESLYKITVSLAEDSKCRKPSIISFASCYLLPFFMTYHFTECYLWLSGAINYLWTSTLLLNVVHYIVFDLPLKTTKRWMMLPLIALSAITNETTGGIIILILLGTFLIKRFSDKKESFFWYCVTIILLLPCICVVILSSGNENRALNSEWASLSEGVLENISAVWNAFRFYLFQMFASNFVQFIVIFTAIIIFTKRDKRKITDILVIVMFLTVAFANASALSLSRAMVARPLIFSCVFITPCFLWALEYLGGSKCFTQFKNIVGLTFFSLTIFLFYNIVVFCEWADKTDKFIGVVKEYAMADKFEELYSWFLSDDCDFDSIAINTKTEYSILVPINSGTKSTAQYALTWMTLYESKWYKYQDADSYAKYYDATAYALDNWDKILEHSKGEVGS